MKAKRLVLAMSIILCSFLFVTGAAADTIISLAFTGSTTSGPVTGAYSVDVTTQAIVGPWSFSTPFGVVSSSVSGAHAVIFTGFGDVSVSFYDTPPLNGVGLEFPISDLQEIGPLQGPGHPSSYVCFAFPSDASGTCSNVLTITSGSTTPTTAVPESSQIGMLGIIALGALGAMRMKGREVPVR